ncbi:MAG: OB-fold domain-containing protein [Bauldia sp.]
MTTAPPLPTPDADSQPFWDACRAGRLEVQRCPKCAHFRWPPMAFCPHCHHRGGDWTALPGTGEVKAFVVVRRAFDPGFEDKVPYVVAHVALDGADGVSIVANVIADPVEAVAIGKRVAVEFYDSGPMRMPRFRLA